MTCQISLKPPNTMLYVLGGKNLSKAIVNFETQFPAAEGNSWQIPAAFSGFTSTPDSPWRHRPLARRKIPGMHLRPQSCWPQCQECSQWTLTRLPGWTLGQSVSSQQVLPGNTNERWERNTGVRAAKGTHKQWRLLVLKKEQKPGSSHRVRTSGF